MAKDKLKERIKKEMLMTPLEECRYLVAKTLKEKDGPDFEAGMVLLASAFVGPNIRKLKTFTGYPLKLVQDIGRKARKAGIWCGSGLDVEWDNEKTGGVAFVCDVATVRGFMERSRA